MIAIEVTYLTFIHYCIHRCIILKRNVYTYSSDINMQIIRHNSDWTLAWRWLRVELLRLRSSRVSISLQCSDILFFSHAAEFGDKNFWIKQQKKQEKAQIVGFSKFVLEWSFLICSLKILFFGVLPVKIELGKSSYQHPRNLGPLRLQIRNSQSVILS